MALLASATAFLTCCVLAYVILSRPAQIEVHPAAVSSGILFDYDTADVARLEMTLRSGESWSAVQREDGALYLEGESGFLVEERTALGLKEAACIIEYSDILAEDFTEYADRLEEFGLAKPRAILRVVYSDDVTCTLNIGDACAADNSFYYMTVSGDKRLMALDRGTAEAIILNKSELHPVVQPTLHKARFDRIALASGEGDIWAEWTLTGGIEAGDAIDHWMLNTPVRYPADGESMSNLLTNLCNLRLGAYIGEATEANMAAYGFDHPRLILTIHQGAGSIGTTDSDGVYSVTDWPEDTLMLTVGGAKNDSVDYVMVDGSIYSSSHYSLQLLFEMNATDTVSRYPVPVALGNLASLAIEKDGNRDVYTLTREEQVAENNELVTDGQGQVLYDVICQKNGVDIPYTSFETAYNRLLTVTVSGRLPEGWEATEPVHTTLSFESEDGERHAIELTRFDALHDAVIVDGCALFYLIRDGMSFTVQDDASEPAEEG